MVGASLNTVKKDEYISLVNEPMNSCLELNGILDSQCAFRPLSKFDQHTMPFAIVRTKSVKLTLAVMCEKRRY